MRPPASLAGPGVLALLLFGAAAVHTGGTPLPIAAQIRTVDLSESPVATVVPAEYEGGFFARIGDVVVNDLGIWVVDPGHKHVLWFDATGRLLVEFGREGSGPGEFLTPSILMVDSLLTIDDPRQGRQVVSYSRDVVNDFRNTVVLLDPGSQSVDTLFSYHWGTAAWKTEAVASARGTPFGAAGAWALLGDTAVAMADGTAGTLTIVTTEAGSIRTNTFDLGFAGRPVTDRDLADLEATIRGDRELPRKMEIDAPSQWSVATSLIPEPE